MAAELAGQMTLFDLGTPAPARGKAARPKLTVAGAASLYRSGMSACEIARDYKLTRSGAEARIRAGGLAVREAWKDYQHGQSASVPCVDSRGIHETAGALIRHGCARLEVQDALF
jgi:hypothetical protein